MNLVDLIPVTGFYPNAKNDIVLSQFGNNLEHKFRIRVAQYLQTDHSATGGYTTNPITHFGQIRAVRL